MSVTITVVVYKCSSAVYQGLAAHKSEIFIQTDCILLFYVLCLYKLLSY